MIPIYSTTVVYDTSFVFAIMTTVQWICNIENKQGVVVNFGRTTTQFKCPLIRPSRHIKNTQYNYEYNKLYKFYKSLAESRIFSPFVRLKPDFSERNKH